MTTELNDKPFVVGSLGVARGGDIKISNDAQFFITKKDSPHLNNQYTNFGIVTKVWMWWKKSQSETKYWK